MKLSQSVLEQETPGCICSAHRWTPGRHYQSIPVLSHSQALKSSGQPVLVNQNGAENITFAYHLDLPLSMDGETEVHRKSSAQIMKQQSQDEAG